MRPCWRDTLTARLAHLPSELSVLLMGCGFVGWRTPWISIMWVLHADMTPSTGNNLAFMGLFVWQYSELRSVMPQP